MLGPADDPDGVLMVVISLLVEASSSLYESDSSSESVVGDVVYIGT